MEEAVVTVTPDGAYVAGNSQGVSFFICCMRDTIKLQALHLWAYVFAWFMQWRQPWCLSNRESIALLSNVSTGTNTGMQSYNGSLWVAMVTITMVTMGHDYKYNRFWMLARCKLPFLPSELKRGFCFGCGFKSHTCPPRNSPLIACVLSHNSVLLLYLDHVLFLSQPLLCIRIQTGTCTHAHCTHALTNTQISTQTWILSHRSITARRGRRQGQAGVLCAPCSCFSNDRVLSSGRTRRATTAQRACACSA